MWLAQHIEGREILLVVPERIFVKDKLSRCNVNKKEKTSAKNKMHFLLP